MSGSKFGRKTLRPFSPASAYPPTPTPTPRSWPRTCPKTLDCGPAQQSSRGARAPGARPRAGTGSPPRLGTSAVSREEEGRPHPGRSASRPLRAGRAAESMCIQLTPRRAVAGWLPRHSARCVCVGVSEDMRAGASVSVRCLCEGTLTFRTRCLGPLPALPPRTGLRWPGWEGTFDLVTWELAPTNLEPGTGLGA